MAKHHIRVVELFAGVGGFRGQFQLTLEGTLELRQLHDLDIEIVKAELQAVRVLGQDGDPVVSQPVCGNGTVG